MTGREIRDRTKVAQILWKNRRNFLRLVDMQSDVDLMPVSLELKIRIETYCGKARMWLLRHGYNGAWPPIAQMQIRA
jgi:hypothetical protein